MKMRFLSLCVCTLLLASLLSGCNNQISLQTELNSSQVPVYLYQGNNNGVFFDRSKNNTTVTFIEEEPFSNTVTDTIFTFSTKLQTVSSHPFPHIDSFVDSTSQSVNVEVKKNLVNRVNLLFVNDSGIEYYLVPKEDYYEIVMWDKEQQELEVVSTVQVDSDHQPLIWNPLQLFSWKIFIHADSKQLCFLDLQSGSYEQQTVIICLNRCMKEKTICCSHLRIIHRIFCSKKQMAIFSRLISVENVFVTMSVIIYLVFFKNKISSTLTRQILTALIQFTFQVTLFRKCFHRIKIIV